MKIIFYYYNSTGTLFVSYSDGNGGYTDHPHLFYSPRGAVQGIRREYGVQRQNTLIFQTYLGGVPKMLKSPNTKKKTDINFFSIPLHEKT